MKIYKNLSFFSSLQAVGIVLLFLLLTRMPIHNFLWWILPIWVIIIFYLVGCFNPVEIRIRENNSVEFVRNPNRIQTIKANQINSVSLYRSLLSIGSKAKHVIIKHEKGKISFSNGLNSRDLEDFISTLTAINPQIKIEKHTTL